MQDITKLNCQAPLPTNISAACDLYLKLWRDSRMRLFRDVDRLGVTGRGSGDLLPTIPLWVDFGSRG
jgi:hypothetical protein